MDPARHPAPHVRVCDRRGRSERWQAEQRTRLYRLLRPLEIVDEPRPRRLPPAVSLPAKDVPILLAAVDARATHLLTGDKDHFGRYYGLSIEGVLILRPASYLVIRAG